MAIILVTRAIPSEGVVDCFFALYGYQMALDPSLLNEYRARALYQPLSRSALIELLRNENSFDEQDSASIDGNLDEIHYKYVQEWQISIYLALLLIWR